MTVNDVTCDPENVHIYHAGTDDEIIPESVVLGSSAGDTLLDHDSLLPPGGAGLSGQPGNGPGL